MIPLLLLTAAKVPTSTTLADFLASSNATGKLVIDAEHVTGKATAKDLAAFDRKEIKIGGVSAIVPRQMVWIDDSLAEGANLYDGLPCATKVLYLLMTLDSQQLRLATGPGIGLGDLRGEQVAVFKSLLPESLSWRTYQIDKDGFPQPQGESSTVGSDQMQRVKLRLSKRLTLSPTFNLPGGRTTFMYMDTAREQVPGEMVRLHTVDPATEGEDRLYGVLVRKVLSNQPKKSDLVYSQPKWNTQVTLPTQTTIGQAIQQIAAATRANLMVDARAQGLSLSIPGGKARAGDLLQAIAIGVTGTYRKVGETFLLTSDLEGQGSRQLKLALWASTVTAEKDRRAQEWRTKIAASGALKPISFSSQDPTAPNDAMRARLQEEEGTAARKPLPVADLSPALQGLVAQMAKLSNRPIEQAGLNPVVVYGFVLPDGTALEPEHDEVGRTDEFYPPATRLTPRTVRPVERPLRLTNRGAARSVILKAMDAITGAAVIETATGYGLTSVWVDTTDAAALQAAIAKGIEKKIGVGLLIRPWELRGNEPLGERDFTLVGPSAMVSPTARQIAQQQKIAALAKTPGLSGVLILDAQPRGYEASDNLRGNDFPRVSQCASQELGYSLENRLGFLRTNTVDPVDVGQEGLQLPVNLRVPFFDDGAFAKADQGKTSAYGFFEKWRVFRSEVNRKGVDGFLSLLNPAAPTFIEPRAEKATISTGNHPWATAWQPGQPMPSIPLRTAPYGPLGSVMIVSLDATTLASEELTRRQLTLYFERSGNATTLDLSTMPLGDASRFLDSWFLRV